MSTATEQSAFTLRINTPNRIKYTQTSILEYENHMESEMQNLKAEMVKKKKNREKLKETRLDSRKTQRNKTKLSQNKKIPRCPRENRLKRKFNQWF